MLFSKTKLSDFYNFSINIQLQGVNFLSIKIPTIDLKKNMKFPYGAKSAVLRFVCGIIHFDLEKGGSTALKDLEITPDKIFTGAHVKIPLQSAENSVVLVALCIYYKRDETFKLNRPAGKSHAGGFAALYNIVDGEVTSYKRPADLKKGTPPPERPEGLDWEVN